MPRRFSPPPPGTAQHVLHVSCSRAPPILMCSWSTSGLAGLPVCPRNKNNHFPRPTCRVLRPPPHYSSTTFFLWFFFLCCFVFCLLPNDFPWPLKLAHIRDPFNLSPWCACRVPGFLFAGLTILKSKCTFAASFLLLMYSPYRAPLHF